MDLNGPQHSPQFLLWYGSRAVSSKSVIHGEYSFDGDRISVAEAWQTWADHRCYRGFWHFSLFMPLNRQARFWRFSAIFNREMSAWKCKKWENCWSRGCSGRSSCSACSTSQLQSCSTSATNSQRKGQRDVPKQLQDKNKNCVNYQRDVDKSVSYCISDDNEV